MDIHILTKLPLWLAAFLLSLTCHEAAHALAGKLGGDSTAANQVTLDPLPHIKREPFGTLVVPILSFVLQGGGWMIGWASAPYDPTWANRHPRKAAGMAAAGPAANFALALLAALAIRIGVAADYFARGGGSLETLAVAPSGIAQGLALFCSVLFSINLILGSFNLIPLPPLDGYAIVPLVLNDRMRDKWFRLFSGGGAMMGLVLAWVLFARLMPPVFRTAIGLLYAGI
jgi:Zn-dependent protease